MSAEPSGAESPSAESPSTESSSAESSSAESSGAESSGAEPARRKRLRRLYAGALIVMSLAAALVVAFWLRLDPNVATLLPEKGEAAALRRYLAGFGGSDLSIVLIRAEPGDDADAAAAEVAKVAAELATRLEQLPSVERAAAGLDASGQLDPMLLWRHADAPTRKKLAQALSPEAMRTRLKTSRDLLLAPGAGSAAKQIARDPLRLQQLLAESRSVGSGFRTQADGSFSSDDGLARLVLVFPQGQALRGADAKRFVADARAVLAKVQQEHPRLELGLTGGHAIAEATERMLVADLELSGTLSMVLASLAFALTFRRLRALLAVMPPLLLGTLWTAAIAALLPGGLSAIGISFMSVVIGVGVDTGVHVYAALLEARQDGLSPTDAAAYARRHTYKPVLVAALTAGAAFASLGLSEISALRQLGILCAGGEMLTAIAIVLVTPELGAWLERGKPQPYRPPRWSAWLSRATSGRLLSALWIGCAVLPIVALAAGMWPALSNAIVGLRPSGLEPLDVQQHVYDAFGGRSGQWVILVADADQQRARQRADTIAEALATDATHLESLDALTALAPAPATQQARFDARDALDLPAKADALHQALQEVGFAPARFEDALSAMRAPPRRLVTLQDLQQSTAAIMLSRYLGSDAGETLVAIYALPKPGIEHEHAIEQAVHAADERATITGYSRLDRSLRASLKRDMPRIGGVASLLVALALALSLRRVRDIGLAALVVVCELALVLFLIGVLEVPLHAYDALVLPVLLGITVDEAMFLLFRARQEQAHDRSVDEVVDETLAREGPPVATTALTTAAGFGALIVCDFDGLRHLGMVGALGSLTGLLVALLVVPAGLRLLPRRAG